MAVVPDINQLAGALNAFQALLAKAQTQVLDEALREKLGQISVQMSQSQSQVMTGYPKAMAGLQQRLDAAQQEAKASLQEAEQLGKQADEIAKARKLPPPPPKEEPLDPTLGEKLRVELLERFGDASKEKTGLTKKPATRSELYELMRQLGVIK
jgi:chromosome segregation ATPase